MNGRTQRVATALLALVLVITTLPAGALPSALEPLAPAPSAALAQGGTDLLRLDAILVSAGQSVQSLAWGDVDSDGDLDIAVGIDGLPNQLYRNTGGTLTLAWSAPVAHQTRSVAWGDVDSDGDLDLAIGNESVWPASGRNELYRNCTIIQPGDGCTSGDLLSKTTVWIAALPISTVSLAWGDVDNDGDLDLATGNREFWYNKQRNQIYRNCTITQPEDGCEAGNIFSQNSIWNPEVNDTVSVAWGDVDNDGDLDLAVGNYNRPNQLYRNCTIDPGPDCDSGEILTLDNAWTPTGQSSSRMAWGDVDGDGDLDLAAGNLLYRNCTIDLAARCTSGGAILQDSGWVPASNGVWDGAWGDVDNDGDLDLAVGQLYRNCTINPDPGCAPNKILILDPTWPQEEKFFLNVAWGDMDNDGDLDLATGNLLYRNYSSLLTPDGGWEPENNATRSVAWGDVDGDGDLDLAVGNGGYWSWASWLPDEKKPNQLYRNCTINTIDPISACTPGTLLAPDTSWNPASNATMSVAWGDVDGDGDLDLAVGNWGQPNQLYHNVGGTLTLAWVDPITTTVTMSVAWGDVDGDGDLDLAVGNSGAPNQLYRNGGGTLTLDERWRPDPKPTNSVAWGDVDGDGDLDLAVGNSGAPNQLYRNRGGILTLDERWTPAVNATISMAWGDVDGDGDLDLAVGNTYSSNQLYRNQSGTLTLDRSWAPARNVTNSVAWGDVDGDGDLDLAVGNGRYYEDRASQLYINMGGALILDPSWNPPNDQNTSVAWGDVDGDGDPDLAVGSIHFINGGGYDRPNQIYINQRNTTAPLAPPTIALSQPLAPTRSPRPAANGLATAPILSGTLSFTYTLRHAQGAPATRVLAQYSLDGGDHWQDASPAVITEPSLLSSSPAGVPHTYTWDTLAGGVFGQTDQAVLRLAVVPVDLEVGRPDAAQDLLSNGLPMQRVPGPFLYTGSGATTMPFRLRGTLPRVVNELGQTVSGASVYHLRADTVTDAPPLKSLVDGASVVLSNADGYVPSRQPLAAEDRLVALQVISDTAKFTLYQTSPITVTPGLPASANGVLTLRTSPADPLIAFKLDVSLEWDARNDTAYVFQLKRDLARASELLYDWTDGQAAIGPVTIYHDRDHWEDVYDDAGRLIAHGADIQIYASNRMRPNSAQGGIVGATITETVTISRTATITATQQVRYDPGMVRMPPTWNRNGDPGGVFGEDWPRTLAHELGHFALYLDDNYLGLDDAGNLINIPSDPDDLGCPGAMSDPYRDNWSELQPDGAPWADKTACAQTLSARTTGRSDWATIKQFYDRTYNGRAFTLGAPLTFGANPGPDNLALALTQITDTGAGQSSPAREAYVTLLDGIDKPYQPGAAARAMLYRSDGLRAIDLGAPTGDLLLVRGGRPGDTLCVYEALAKRVGCTALSQATTRLKLPTRQSWPPDIQISQVTTRTITLRVSTPLTVSAPLAVQVFPDEGAPITITLSDLGDGAYTGTGTFSATPALGGLLRLCVTDNQGRCKAPGLSPAEAVYEAVTDYSLGGDPQAPRRRQKRRSSRRAPALSADGQAILFTPDSSPVAPGEFYAFQTVDRLPSEPAPPSWATPVGFGYRLIASEALKAKISAASLALSYFPEDVPAGAESGIRVYFLPNGGRVWQPRDDTVVDLESNTATTRAVGEGIYVLMASIPLALDAGWNLIYDYPGVSQDLPAALAGAGERYSLAYGYEAGDAADPWKLYARGLGAAWGTIVNDLERLEHGASYWLHATDAGTVPVRPEGASAGRPQGGVMIGIPPATYYGVVPPGAEEAQRVEALVGPEGQRCGSADIEAISVGGQSYRAFSINVLAYGGGAAAGCGAPGATVRLVFLDAADTEVGSYHRIWDNTRLIQINLPLPGPHRAYLPLIAQPEAP